MYSTHRILGTSRSMLYKILIYITPSLVRYTLFYELHNLLVSTISILKFQITTYISNYHGVIELFGTINQHKLIFTTYVLNYHGGQRIIWHYHNQHKLISCTLFFFFFFYQECCFTCIAMKN